MKTIKILMLEDSPYDVELVQYELKKGNIDFISRVVETKTDFKKELNDFEPDIILSDHSMPQFNSIEALKIYNEEGIGVPFILVTGSVSEEFAVQAILAGASDYILKTNLTRLPSAVNNALQSWRIIKDKEKAEKEVKLMNVFLDQVIDSQPIVFYVAKVEEDFPIIFISKNVKHITGYGSREFIENPLLWSRNIVADDEVGVLDSLDQLIALGSGDYEYKWECADGNVKWFVDYFTVIKDENDQAFIHGSRIDITKLKNADLRKLVFSKGMDEMLFMISHKIRHSIAQILGLSSLVEEESIAEEELKKIIGYMKEPTQSLNLFTKELTDLLGDLKKRNNRLQ
ncbi:MAG: response regulator [Bacteroidota bacterium]